MNEYAIRMINRMHRDMKIDITECRDALKEINGAFSLELLKQALFLENLLALGEDGIRQIWHDAKIRRHGYSRAGEIIQYRKASVGIKDEAVAEKVDVKWFGQKTMELDNEVAVVEN